MVTTPGTLIIKILYGKFVKSADLFGYMDPYIKLLYNLKEYRTKTIKNSGKEADWNEIIVIDVDSAMDELLIQCID